jgi:hypothetical protein
MKMEEEKAAGLLAKDFVEDALHVGGITDSRQKRKENSAGISERST